jgi:hypothetical protein
MDRQEELMRTRLVFEAWIEKYENVPGFDPDNPTAEQATDHYNALKAEFGQVGKGKFAESVAAMSEEELAQLRTLSIYQPERSKVE